MVRGWQRLGPTAGIKAWADAALPLARAALATTSDPLRCGGTWAVGLDLLPNDDTGAVGGVDLPWADLGLVREPLHRAQLSTIHPNYPQPSTEESATAYAFRLNRDAAHLDGLLPIGPDRQRMVKEPNAWILGLPLNRADAGAAPLVVWEGSHLVMQAALSPLLAQAEVPAEVDITDAYQAARAEVFRTCARLELPGTPGEAVILHRHLIHGVAPWAAGATAEEPGRMVAYFRPLLDSVSEWITP